MITFTKAFQTEDGRTHATIEAAQEHAIAAVLWPDITGGNIGRILVDTTTTEIVKKIVSNRSALLNILTTTATSRPRARRANGAKRTKKVGGAVITGA